MKKMILALVGLVMVMTGCGEKKKPSTTPLHPSQPGIVATTDDEMRELVTSMTGSDDWKMILSSNFYSVMDEAQHLVMGNKEGDVYTPWDWSCKTRGASAGNYTHAVGSIAIGQDSVTVAMTYRDATQSKGYTLVMKHENGRWCVDDVVWATGDSERRAAEAYATDAINNLSTGDASYLLDTRLDGMVPDAGSLSSSNPYETHFQALDYSIKCIETAHHYLKQNRSFTPALEKRLLTTLQSLKNRKK